MISGANQVASADLNFVNCLMDNMLTTAVWPRLFHPELGDGERPGPGKVSMPQGPVLIRRIRTCIVPVLKLRSGTALLARDEQRANSSSADTLSRLSVVSSHVRMLTEKVPF